jgi:uncharacterized protein
MKKLTGIFAFLLALTFAVSGFALAIEVINPTDQFYVNDDASILTEETENYIVAQNEVLEEACGGQIVVVTVDFLAGQNIEEYSYTVMNEWGIGSSELKNGLLILLVPGEEHFWGVQGSGIAGVLTASLIGSYLEEYLAPKFTTKDYDGAVRDAFDAFIGWYDNFYHIDVQSGNTNPLVPDIGTTTPSIDESTEPESPLDQQTPGISTGGAFGAMLGTIFIIIAGLAVLAFAAVSVPRSIYLRRRGYHYGVFNRMFWSHRPPPPPRYRPPMGGMGGRPPMGGMGDRPPMGGMGGRPPMGGMGDRPPMGGMGSRPSAPPRRTGGGGSTRGGGAGRGGFGGGRRTGGGGSTRGGGAGRK